MIFFWVVNNYGCWLACFVILLNCCLSCFLECSFLITCHSFRFPNSMILPVMSPRRTRYFSTPRKGHNPLQGRAYYQLLECLGVRSLTPLDAIPLKLILSVSLAFGCILCSKSTLSMIFLVEPILLLSVEHFVQCGKPEANGSGYCSLFSLLQISQFFFPSSLLKKIGDMSGKHIIALAHMHSLSHQDIWTYLNHFF